MKHSILRVTVPLTIVIVVLTSIAVSLPYYRFSKQLLLERAMAELADQGRTGTLQTSLAVEDTIHETLLLSGSDDVKGFLLHPTSLSQVHRQTLERHLLNKGALGKIDIYPRSWPEGEALIVRREGGRISTEVKTREQLHRDQTDPMGDMIHKAMGLGFGETVHSELDSGGQMPRVAVIQIAAAVRDGKDTIGVIVIHLDLQTVLSPHLDDQTYADTWTYLTNSSGKILMVRQPGKIEAGPGNDQISQWVMDHGNVVDLPSSQVSRRRIAGHEFAVYHHTIYYTKHNGDFLNLYTLKHYQRINGKVNDVLLQTLVVSITSIAIAVLALVLFSRRLARPIEQIKSALRAFRKGEAVTGLPTDRSDELGELGRSIDNMIREVRERTAELERSQGKLNALFEAVQEGVVITDQDGIIESVNPSLCHMFGYSEKELIGQSNVVLMPAPYATHHDRYMRESIRNGTLGFMGMYRDLTGLRKDGSTFPVVINIETLKLRDEQLFAAIIRDVTRQKEYERELLNAKMRAEVANEAKTNFLSMMSHEIRTPLNGVMGVLQILDSEISDPEQKEFLDVASRSASNLLHIVNDILDISKAESGSMELEEQEFNLRDLLEDSVELYMAKLADNDIRMRFFVPLNMPIIVIGDAFRLQQMVNNLLSNAIKFTAEGEIDLTLNWEPRDDASINVLIDVSDTGVGIGKDKLKSIFEPFIQADSSTSRAYGGTGLGLSIVKRITALMGGRVWVTSELGTGSTFHLYLPFQKSAFETEKSSHWLQGRRVLYVGEKDDNTMLLEYLEHYDAVVDVAGQVELKQADLVGDKQYDVVIVQCSDEDATAWINRLAESAVENTKLICVWDRIESRHTDMHHTVLCLHEPVLSRTLDTLFNSLGQQPAALVGQGQIHHGDTTMPKILLVEDNPVNQMVAKSMVAKMGYEAVIANNGQEALDIIKSEDIDLVLMDCHMPVMDGFEATEQIRRHLDGKPLPIIAMTADASVSDRDRCISAGMDDHLAKPVKMDILQSTLERWLQDRD